MNVEHEVVVIYNALEKVYCVELDVDVNGTYANSINLAKMKTETRAQYFAELIEEGYDVDDAWDELNAHY
jgi:hypothetical protein